ncbi:hypothetical protein KAK06_23670 [Ideonella sp. 4Y11]|uniref:Lipocalin-like domain-containing protein n=1 Tax=Ideonella aquatica TaxID=2824119 RepID=A0A940YSB1_9BURK|nr:hypothetical protein [Ideonella aquatica]MBQ0961957.1 hypothetical protein [Ideonella aquatica]
MRPLSLPPLLSLPSLLLLVSSLAACSTAGPARAPAAAELVGTWQVDLRPTPDAPPYLQAFVVTGVQGKRFSGSFYGTPISQSQINTDWGAVRIAFVTGDGSGEYHHSAVLSGNRLEGLTHSVGRDFLAYWSATR